MDLKQYFRKLRETESSLVDTYPVVVSLETADGGKGGVISEVSRAVAAKLIVENRAVLATEDQKAIYLHDQDLAKRTAEKAELARRVQVAIIADPDLQTSVSNRRNPQSGGAK